MYIEWMVAFELLFMLLNVYLYSYEKRGLDVPFDEILNSASFIVAIVFVGLFSFLVPITTLIVYIIFITRITKQAPATSSKFDKKQWNYNFDANMQYWKKKVAYKNLCLHSKLLSGENGEENRNSRTKSTLS